MTSTLRIAVADDELDMREFFRRMLPRRGHQVVSIAATGRQLVEHCREHKPDLVITDIEMPELDGLDAAREICSERSIPIILVSGHCDEEALPRGNRTMFFLRKPFSISDLEVAIEAALQSVTRRQVPDGEPPTQGPRETKT